MCRNKQRHRTLQIQRAAKLLVTPFLLASPAAVFAEPVVNGNTISWPEDGWYQVQSADGATTLCNGGKSCTVDPGRYLVINHTLGIRYTDVQVEDEPGRNAVLVSGQTISWPDFGWYQVQSADGLETYCNGGRFCDVEPGVYIVINHTTGVRFTDVRVSDGVSAVINRNNHIELLEQVFEVYTGTLYGGELPGVPTGFMDSHLSTSVEVPEDIQNENHHVVMFDYACDNGGVLGYTQRSGFPYWVEEMEWMDCLDGDIIRNGMAYSQDNNGYYGYYRYLMKSLSYTADYPSGEKMTVSGSYGSISESHIDPSIRTIRRWTTEDFDYQLQSESSLLEVGDANTNIRYTWLGRNTSVLSAGMSGSFRLKSDLSDNQDIDVTMSEPLTADVTGDFGSSYPDEWSFTLGTLELSAEDGSALRLKADSGDVDTVEITLLQDGAELETFQQPWSLWWDVLENVQSDPRSAK